MTVPKVGNLCLRMLGYLRCTNLSIVLQRFLKLYSEIDRQLRIKCRINHRLRKSWFLGTSIRLSTAHQMQHKIADWERTGSSAHQCASLKDYSPTTCQQLCSSLWARWGRMRSSLRPRPDQQLRSFLRARQSCYCSAFSTLHNPQRRPLSSRSRGDCCPPFRRLSAHTDEARTQPASVVSINL